MTALLALVLAASPLEVRVLESAHPASAHLQAKSLRCGDAPLTGPVDVAPGKHELEVAGKECPFVLAEGGVTVTVGTLHRTYRGALRLTLEGGGLRLMNLVDSEDYLPSVVGATLSSGSSALFEAQAIVARTLAVSARTRHAGDGYALCDEAHCQPYGGIEAETREATRAVQATRGQVLLVGGLTARPTFFHQSCGGRTSDGADLLGVESAGPGVNDDTAAEVAPWEWSVDRVALAHALGGTPDAPVFEPLRRDRAGRVLELKAFGRRFSGAQLLAALEKAEGTQPLPSLRFTVEEENQTLHFSGTGSGHGVGLCHAGARAQASRGADARAILKRYFPQSQVKVLTGEEVGSTPSRSGRADAER